MSMWSPAMGWASPSPFGGWLKGSTARAERQDVKQNVKYRN